jgi:hypothetical protein
LNIDTLTLRTPHHATTSPIAAVVANWHDENHDGGFAMCQQQPCHAVRDAEHFEE